MGLVLELARILRERGVATSVLFGQSLLLQPHTHADYLYGYQRYLFTFIVIKPHRNPGNNLSNGSLPSFSRNIAEEGPEM